MFDNNDTEREEPTMAGQTSEQIVVGVDGSTASHAALRWAARQAAKAGGTVVAVHAIRSSETHEWAAQPTNYGTIPTPVKFDDAEIAATINESVAEQLRAAGLDPATTPVDVRAIEGRPVEVLLDAAQDADLLVVGRTGHGGFAGLLLGSVSRHCVEHAACTVVVVPVDDEETE